MIEVQVTNNMMAALVDWQNLAMQSYEGAAKLFRDAVQETLGQEARHAAEHARPFFPRLKHTGDLQRSVHYVGGIDPVDGNIYFEVFIAADYGIEYEDLYPVLAPVFEKASSALIELMSSTQKTTIATGGAFTVPTSTWVTTVYIHQINYSYPDLNLEKEVRSY